MQQLLIVVSYTKGVANPILAKAEEKAQQCTDPKAAERIRTHAAALAGYHDNLDHFVETLSNPDNRGRTCHFEVIVEITGKGQLDIRQFGLKGGGNGHAEYQPIASCRLTGEDPPAAPD